MRKLGVFLILLALLLPASGCKNVTTIDWNDPQQFHAAVVKYKASVRAGTAAITSVALKLAAKEMSEADLQQIVGVTHAVGSVLLEMSSTGTSIDLDRTKEVVLALIGRLDFKYKDIAIELTVNTLDLAEITLASFAAELDTDLRYRAIRLLVQAASAGLLDITSKYYDEDNEWIPRPPPPTASIRGQIRRNQEPQNRLTQASPLILNNPARSSPRNFRSHHLVHVMCI